MPRDEKQTQPPAVEFPWGDSLAGLPRCPQAPDDPAKLTGGEVAHVGVLLVHGVGFQRSGDTFRESVGPLVRLLREAGFKDRDPLEDPVRLAAQALPGSDVPFVELDLPRSGSSAREHWAITEAYWAASFAPPSFATMVGWLGSQGKAAMAARRLSAQRPRTRPDLTERVEDPGDPRLIVLSVVVILVLAVYAVLRTIFSIIPIQVIRERVIGSIDLFLQEWAGDMRVLLIDETQAGMVRFRIARSIRALQAYGCSSVVVVAHSGGAVATYMTLNDPRYQDLPVRTLVTYGSGLNIAWRLLGLNKDTPANKALLVGGGLARTLPDSIRWYDFWATDDPVPAGPVDDSPRGVAPEFDTQPPKARGHRVNNRWNFLGDHGTYLDNDEEFLVPLAERIDDQVRPKDGARLFEHWPEESRAKAVRSRLERVAALSVWRRWAASCGLLAIFGAVAAGLARFWSDPEQRSSFARPLPDVTNCIEGFVRHLLDDDKPGGCAVLETAQSTDGVSLISNALVLTGQIGWVAILASLCILLFPQSKDWRHALASNIWARRASVVVSRLMLLVLLIAAFVGIPGLLGVSLESSQISDAGWSLAIQNGFEDLTRPLLQPLGRFGSAVMNFFVAALFFGLTLGVLMLLGRFVRTSRGDLLRSVVVDVGIVLVSVWFLASLIVTAADTGGFRSNLLGWLILLLTFLIINRIGQWRWNQWDGQERWEMRMAAAGLEKKRAAGRRFDAAVFATLAIGALVAAVGFALRAVWIDAANMILVGAGVTLLAGICAGLAQDEVNGRPKPPGEEDLGQGPTIVSQTAARY